MLDYKENSRPMKNQKQIREEIAKLLSIDSTVHDAKIYIA